MTNRSKLSQGLHNDPWLKEQGILPPGHVDAPPTAGTIFWHLIDDVIQKVNGFQNVIKLYN